MPISELSMGEDKLKNRDFYSRLLLSHHASDREIKKAYRDIAKVYHPDTLLYGNARDDLSERHYEIFKLLTEAYNTLSNADKRRAYDRLLRAHQIASLRERLGKPQVRRVIRRRRRRKRRSNSGHSVLNASLSRGMATMIRHLIIGLRTS